jgi:hypothetical protein
VFISSALDYNDITTQIYRLHIFSRDYKRVLTPKDDEDIESMNGRELHAKRKQKIKIVT